MIRFVFTVAALGLAGACSAQPAGNNAGTPANAAAPAVAPAAVTLTAADGAKVYGDYYPAAHPRALILLFHQAGSSAAEYATIAPKLNEMGYSALAIDQRSGGDMFGPNRTVKALGGSQDYMKAKQDLKAALDWAEGKGLPIVLWGSSYSSSLIFPLAAENPGKAKALLAFSPGEYFDDKTMIETAAAKIDVPVFVTCAPTSEEIQRATPIVDALKSKDKQFYVPKAGVHGSSTLIAGRDPSGAAANWAAVTKFLKAAAG
jgi:pimeloyl-ACP methyl ester carboxylesterase